MDHINFDEFPLVKNNYKENIDLNNIPIINLTNFSDINDNKNNIDSNNSVSTEAIIFSNTHNNDLNLLSHTGEHLDSYLEDYIDSYSKGNINSDSKSNIDLKEASSIESNYFSLHNNLPVEQKKSNNFPSHNNLIIKQKQLTLDDCLKELKEKYTSISLDSKTISDIDLKMKEIYKYENYKYIRDIIINKYKNFGCPRNFIQSNKVKCDYILSCCLKDISNSYYLFFIGRIYKIDNDLNRCIIFYNKSVALNNPFAMNALAYMYYYGEVIKQNYEKAIELYKRAISLNHSDSTNDLGTLYYSENENIKNYDNANYWVNESVKLNSTLAINNLAALYFNKREVYKTNEEAINLYIKGAKLGNKESKENLKKIINIDIDVLINIFVDKENKIKELEKKINNLETYIVHLETLPLGKEYQNAIKDFNDLCNK